MKLIPIIVLFLQAAASYGQDVLTETNTGRNRITCNGMLVLGSWGIANTATGLIAYGTASGQARYFHQMNAGWGIINTGLAVAGFLGSKKEDVNAYSLARTIKSQHNIEKVLLLNAGLDIGYIAAGAWLNERGVTKNSARLQGYGKSVMMQGAFLLIFDGVMYAMHHKNSKKLDAVLQQVKLGATGNGLGMHIYLR